MPRYVWHELHEWGGRGSFQCARFVRSRARCVSQVDIGVTELLFRQTNFLIRNMKREMAKQHHAMKFNGGRNPSGKVTKLDE